MNRTPTPTECTLRLLRTPNVYPRTRNIYPRTPRFTPTYTHCRGRFIVPAYHGIYGVDNRVQPMFYPRAPIVIRGCNLHNSVRTGAMNRSPTPTECMLQLLRTPNVYPRTRNIYPRTPTVGSRFIVPHITEHTLWIVHAHQCLFANALYTKVWLSCNLH